MKKSLSIVLAILFLNSFLVACTAREDQVEIEVEVNFLDIKAIHNSVKEKLGEDYLPDTSLSLDDLSDLMDLEKDSIEEYIAERSKDEDVLDTFIAVNAKKDTSYDLAQKFLRYKEKLEREILKHPSSLAKIRASKVIRKGDSVFFIMIGKPNIIENQESKESIDFSQREIQRVEAVIDEACG